MFNLLFQATDMKISQLVCSLVNASEKAAAIARTIRSEHALFQLLVEEKEGDQKNKRFFKDFKTLGDVLIQEVVRHDVGKQVSIQCRNSSFLKCNHFMCM
jgi:inositol polyphosphate 1-phosphatase